MKNIFKIRPIKRLKSKKGAAEILSLIICFSVLTFMMFFPLASYAVNQKRNLIEDTKTIGIEMCARNGGLTTAVKNAILQDLQTKGFDSSKVVLKSNTDDAHLIYREDSTPITLTIYVPANDDVVFLKAVWSLVGSGGSSVGFFGNSSATYWYCSKGTMLSEKIHP